MTVLFANDRTDSRLLTCHIMKFATYFKNNKLCLYWAFKQYNFSKIGPVAAVHIQ